MLDVRQDISGAHSVGPILNYIQRVIGRTQRKNIGIVMETGPEVPDDLSVLTVNEKNTLYQDLCKWAQRCRAVGNISYAIYRQNHDDHAIRVEMIRWVTASIIADADVKLLEASLGEEIGKQRSSD